MNNYMNLTRKELILLCKEQNIKGVSTKKKSELITLLETTTAQITRQEGLPTRQEEDKVKRLNYIGSKFQLLEWITSAIQKHTGWTTFSDKKIGDLFSGTGIISYHFRKLGSHIISNDAELFSSIITRAFTISDYTSKCKEIIDQLNKEILTTNNQGYITKNYSPYNECERKFFTVETAQKIDYIRQRLEELKSDITEEEYTFLLASLLVSADSVSNVPAVYGCYLKNFKNKALKSFVLIPIHITKTIHIHTNKTSSSKTFNYDVLNEELFKEIDTDIVYLDPPYNERQYSKNYFPLNMIAKTPTSLEREPPLKGKTGIPTDCFISPFCKKGKSVEDAFETLFKRLKTKWIFLSYNSESLITKERMCELMQPYGDVSVEEREYKRFKSFEYNEDKTIKEYLFCLKLKE